jgi:hypothetical protein
MKISKIKLIKGGLKGMKVTYLKPVKKDGMNWMVPHDVKYPYPVVGKIGGIIQDLREHFGEIVGLNGSDGFGHVSIVGVERGEDNYCLEASVETMPGCEATWKTPVINELSMYHKENEVQELLDQVWNMVEEYAIGGIKMDAAQVVMEFHKKDDDFDMDAFNVLSEGEKQIMMIAELEKAGMIILQPEPEMKVA